MSSPKSFYSLKHLALQPSQRSSAFVLVLLRIVQNLECFVEVQVSMRILARPDPLLDDDGAGGECRDDGQGQERAASDQAVATAFL